MRIVYLDEAGISNPKHEPFVVVAGVIINADKEWLSVEQYLRDMVGRRVPIDRRSGFFFHATELFSGGKTFPRETWPRELRWPILRELCEIPSIFGLPVVVSHISREEFAKVNVGMNAPEITIQAQVIASAGCTLTVERYMRNQANADEVALLIHENNQRAAAWLRGLHNILRTEIGMMPFVGYSELMKYLPLGRIIDTVHFAAKTDSSILQVADACAFACKRKLMGTKEADYFFEPLRSAFV
jgi:hypothetical protein